MPSLQPTPGAVMPSTSGLNYESLLARCPQTEWSPDPRTMLFFQEDDSRIGAEEFRTLRSRLYQIREKMPLQTPVGDQRASQRREVFRGCQSRPGPGAPARTPRSHHRRRSAQPRHAPPPGSAPVARIGRVPVGRMRRVRRHATRAHGKPVLHARRPQIPAAPPNCSPTAV
jgi:hypothetical protein